MNMIGHNYVSIQSSIRMILRDFLEYSICDTSHFIQNHCMILNLTKMYFTVFNERGYEIKPR